MGERAAALVGPVQLGDARLNQRLGLLTALIGQDLLVEKVVVLPDVKESAFQARPRSHSACDIELAAARFDHRNDECFIRVHH